MKCPVCGNEYLVPYCDFCGTNLIEIDGNWYVEVLYQPLLDFIDSREDFINVQTSIKNIVEEASSPTFLSDKDNPSYYEIIEATVNKLVDVNNQIKNADNVLQTELLSEDTLSIVRTFNTLWGDVEFLLRDTAVILADILENIKYVITRMTEVLVHDVKAQEIFRRYNIADMFDDLDSVNYKNHSSSRRLDL